MHTDAIFKAAHRQDVKCQFFSYLSEITSVIYRHLCCEVDYTKINFFLGLPKRANTLFFYLMGV